MATPGVRTASAVAAIGVGMTLAPPAAHADDPIVGPAVGSQCSHDQQNTVTTSNSNQQVRCVFVYGQGYAWLPDVGPQQDPRMAAAPPEVQADSYNYCLAHFDRPWECHHDHLRDSIADNAKTPPTRAPYPGRLHIGLC